MSWDAAYRRRTRLSRAIIETQGEPVDSKHEENVTTCRVCGETNVRATARFCDQCGAPTRDPPTVGEHKQVTVLFCDVVGSMALAAALGPERLREVMNDLFNLSAVVVQRFGGMVDKFTGDGLMALFGAPMALEDHASRACIAALQIQEVARELAVEVRNRDGVELRLFSMISTFGTPYDITTDEIRVETFFPEDAPTEALLKNLATL